MHTNPDRQYFYALLETYRPQIAQFYQDIVISRYDKIRAALGPAFHNVHNDWTWARVFRVTVAPNIKSTGVGNARVVEIDPAKLAYNADAYAAETIDNWVDKITSKAAGVEQATVHI